VAETNNESRQDAPTLGAVLRSESLINRDTEFDTAADRALHDRPYFSIRARLILAFAFFFFLSLAMSVWAIRTVAEVNDKILFLEVAEDYEVEIQQARRFEKNFLLYGTNLEDAIEHTHTAQRAIAEHREQLRKVVGAQTLQIMNTHLTDYLDLLACLGRGESARCEGQLRELGAQMVTLAQDLVGQERALVHSKLVLARRVPFVFLLILGVFMVLVVNFLALQIIRTLSRFKAYTERIATGDFTPILPSRRYRDEFSELALMINRMVRELERQQQILVESHKLRAMGTLVAGVAHELNNPINNVMLTASVLQEDSESMNDHERQEMYGDIISQTERSKRIIANLLDYARESETTIQPLDVRRILQDTVALVGNHIALKKIHLTMDLQDNLPTVHGDAQLLSQVFMNLILNAVDALPERGEIRVVADTETRKGYLAAKVVDNGPGIPEHIMDHIFDPFFTTKPKGEGTGLGLSVSRGIVRKLGGDLLAESQVGVGTTFTVLLPPTTVPSDLSSLRGAPARPVASRDPVDAQGA
jgi:two-component system NtrC family sensor kinase